MAVRPGQTASSRASGKARGPPPFFSSQRSPAKSNPVAIGLRLLLPGVAPPPCSSPASRHRPGVHPTPPLPRRPAPASPRADLAPVRHGRRPCARAGSVGRRGTTGRRRRAPAGAGSIARLATGSSDVPSRPRRPPSWKKPAASPSSPTDAATAVKSPPVVAPEQGGQGRRLLHKRLRGGSSGQAASSEDSSTARSYRRPAQLRMDPRQFNVDDGSVGQFSGGNNGAYQSGWNPYMYGFQPTPGWIPQVFQPRPPNMMNPSGYAPEGVHQAGIPQTSAHHSEANLEEVPAATAQTRSKKSGSRTKLGNFSPDEDKNLVKSWLEISCDPIKNTGQKKDRMWDRIIGRYNLRRASNPVRTVRSLQSRWDTIRAEVALFASYYADSIRENPSGMSDADKTTHAASNFSDVEGRNFGFLHCWNLMKDAPKWQDLNTTNITTAARGEGFGEDRTAGDDTVDHVEGRSSPVQSGAQARRPMGRDAAKAAKKKANSDAASVSSAEYAARMQDLSMHRMSFMEEEAERKKDRFQQLALFDEKRLEEMRRHNDLNEAMLKMEQDKLAFSREQHEDNQREKDLEILKMDLDSCPPDLRLYYQGCREEILERQAARRRRRQAP